MMGGVSPETCWASHKHGIINFGTLLHLVGYFGIKYYTTLSILRGVWNVTHWLPSDFHYTMYTLHNKVSSCDNLLQERKSVVNHVIPKYTYLPKHLEWPKSMTKSSVGGNTESALTRIAKQNFIIQVNITA